MFPFRLLDICQITLPQAYTFATLPSFLHTLLNPASAPLLSSQLISNIALTQTSLQILSENTNFKMTGKSNLLSYSTSLCELLPTEAEIASNVYQMNAVQLKSTLINWYYLLDTMKPIKISLEDQYAKLAETETDQKAKLKEQLDNLDEKIKHFEKLIKDSESNLKEISLLKDKHHQIYQKLNVKDNTNDDFDAEEVVFRIGYFKNDETMKFTEFFNKLNLYIKNKKLSEDGVISILSMLLKDEPFQVFMDLHNQDSDLDAIMNALASQYSDKKTITQYSNMLRNFKRNSGETLRAAMSRCSSIISMTSYLVPQDSLSLK